MPVWRVLRWLVAVVVPAAGFAIVLWIASGWGGLDRATALALATATIPLVGAPFAWWANQPIETFRDRVWHSSSPSHPT